MNIYTPYTYLIGWSNLNLWYYGVRYATGCNPKELWNTYFTSSNYVSETRAVYGEPDIIEIRRIFACPNEAIKWEKKVLSRMKVNESDAWINRSTGIGVSYPLSVETRQKMSIARQGKVLSDETKARMSEASKRRPPRSKEHSSKIAEKNRGRKHTKQAKEKISNAMLDREFSDTHKENLSKSLSGRKLSDSHVANMKKSLTGRKASEEHRRKISEAIKAKWAARKEA